ncbi:MAG: PAS domain S-box protein [Polyangiaceae bacterium]|nr:PAS domain S-box protein [Polyangiaceae bacterium]
MRASREAKLALLGRGLSLAGAALGGFGLVGWATKTETLLSFVPGQSAMRLNTAIALTLLGLVGALRDRPSARFPVRVAWISAASLVLAIGVATLLEYALQRDLRINSVVENVWPGSPANRPSAPTAAALSLLAISIFTFDVRRSARLRPAELCALSAGLIAFLALLGHIFGAGPLYRATGAPIVGVSLPTAIAVGAISAGLLLERNTAGVMRTITSTGPGGVMLRHLLLAMLVAAPALGLFVVRVFATLDIVDPPLIVATQTGLMAGVGFVMITLAALPLDRTHRKLERSRARARAIVDQASDGIFVLDLSGRCLEVNTAGCRILGKSRSAVAGHPLAEFVSPVDASRFMELRDELLQGGSSVVDCEFRREDGPPAAVEVSTTILSDQRWQIIARDISERRAAEQALARERARFEGIISIAPDAIISIDESQQITIFNHGAERIFGYAADEVVGNPLELLIPERFRKLHRSHVRSFALGSETSRQLEHRGKGIYGLRRGGAEFPAEAGISKLALDGDLTLTVVLRDVTERLRLEEELRGAKRFLDNVLESATDHAVIALDLDCRVLLFNAGASRSYGYAPSELVGQSADLLFARDEECASRIRGLYARALESGSAETSCTQRRKNGSVFTASVVVSRRLNDDGQSIGYLVISRDVTRETRRAEQEHLLAAMSLLLTESLEQSEIVTGASELLVKQLAEICVIELLDDPDDGQFRSRRTVAHRDPSAGPVVAALEEMGFGKPYSSLDDATARRTTAVVPRVTTRYLDLIARDETHRELLAQLAPTSLAWTPLRARDSLIGTLLLISTDRDRAFMPEDAAFVEEVAAHFALAVDNARLFAVAKKAIAARDDVLSVVAHDLRNPLGAVLLQAGVLRARGTESDCRAAAVIDRAARRMNRLIQDLLDVTRLEAGSSLSLDLDRISPSAIIAEAVEAQRPHASAVSVELLVDIEEGLPALQADRDRLLQVFENLLGNALKFTPPGGTVTVGARRTDDNIHFWVADTRRGIDEGDLPHVFDRFWQAKLARRRGAGLGLPIVKGIVESHGGRAWAESVVGRGTTLHFTVPIQPSEHTGAPT